MKTFSQITKIHGTDDGAPPQTGPTHTIPILIEVQTVLGRDFLEISQSAAVELVEELSKRLRVRGFL